ASVCQAVGGRAAYRCIVACGQLMRALQYLGFDAELIPACTSVSRVERGDVRMADIGVWDHPPVIRSNGTTDGHLAVWSDSLNRCIDIGVCHEPALRRASTGEQVLTLPAILPVPGGRQQLLHTARSIVTLRHPFALSWMFFPQWRSRFDPLLDHHSAVIEHGGLALAHVVVDLLSAVAVYRDLGQLGELYPRLGSLVYGQALLPELDDYPPPRTSDSGARTDVDQTRRDIEPHVLEEGG
ncbi:MAG: hypothetical protein JWN43_2255, partial [Gammaproteobacteria bacterium]|nr:hypothetical protein [Gammaproteobacteria bacterium]